MFFYLEYPIKKDETPQGFYWLSYPQGKPKGALESPWYVQHRLKGEKFYLVFVWERNGATIVCSFGEGCLRHKRYSDVIASGGSLVGPLIPWEAMTP